MIGRRFAASQPGHAIAAARATYAARARLHAHSTAPHHLLVVLDVRANRRRHAPASSNGAAPAATRRGRRRLSGPAGAGAGASAAAAGLVVVHPHLEDLPGDPDLSAEAAHLVVPRRAAGLPLGHPPAEPLREPRHALLLLLRELCPRPPPAPGAVRAGVTAHAGRSSRSVVRATAVARGGASRGGQHRAVRPRRGVQERLPVEVAVAAAGGAEHRCGLAVVGGVLAASVRSVCPELRRVVAHALAVHLPRPLLVLLLMHCAPALLLPASLNLFLPFLLGLVACSALLCSALLSLSLSLSLSLASYQD
jgi:hypothetical protein|uniref:Uncharacterized protein n=1 Tax=Zea mays TaxID=4577 RepID=A0A804M305_MAIZE